LDDGFDDVGNGDVLASNLSVFTPSLINGVSMSTQHQVKSNPSQVASAQPLPSQYLHWIVFVFLAAFGAICITFPIAMLRVSGMEKFRGFHVKSFPLESQMASSEGSSQSPTAQAQNVTASSEPNKLQNEVAISETIKLQEVEYSPVEKISFEERLKSENCGMAQPTPDDLTYVRSQPDPDADIIVGVPEGKPMMMMSNKDVFIQVELPDGTQGWVYEDRIIPCNL
jgi:hypothetical protein